MHSKGDVDGDAAGGPFASETHIRVLDVMERRPVGTVSYTHLTLPTILRV